MQQRIIESLDELKELAGEEVAVTDYIHVGQGRIEQFAETTGDTQWIHVDVERSRKESPYGSTIAHGFLKLSLLTPLMQSAIKVNGVRMAINYGLDRVRFPAAVPSGSNIRARVKLQSIEDVTGGIQAKWAVTVEREDGEKPVCVAEWLVRYYT
jgi:acyl dehydratase